MNRIGNSTSTAIVPKLEPSISHVMSIATAGAIMLQTAPLLEDWVPALTTEGVQLIGHASGHPVHGDQLVMTSQVWFADPHGGWIRTLSRFYRLGAPADPNDLRRILTPAPNSNAIGKDDGSEDNA